MFDESKNILVGRIKDNKLAVGNFITIFDSGTIDVGEEYVNANGEIKYRGTQYKTDGTSKKWGY